MRVAAADHRLPADAHRAYAIVIARNLLVAHARHQSVRSRHLHRLLEQPDPGGPEQLVLDNEETNAMAAALERLDADDRELLLRHEAEGIDLATLAEEAHVSTGAIAMRLARARAELRLEFLSRSATSSCRPTGVGPCCSRCPRVTAASRGRWTLPGISTTATCARRWRRRSGSGAGGSQAGSSYRSAKPSGGDGGRCATTRSASLPRQRRWSVATAGLVMAQPWTGEPSPPSTTSSTDMTLTEGRDTIPPDPVPTPRTWHHHGVDDGDDRRARHPGSGGFLVPGPGAARPPRSPCRRRLPVREHHARRHRRHHRRGLSGHDSRRAHRLGSAHW